MPTAQNLEAWDPVGEGDTSGGGVARDSPMEGSREDHCTLKPAGSPEGSLQGQRFTHVVVGTTVVFYY